MTDQAEKTLRSLRNGREASFFDLCSIDQVTKEDLSLILELARAFRELKTKKLSLCQGATQINAFFENSTRTLTSFDLAAKHLGMDTANITGSTSSVKKGESYQDTIHTLSSYHPKTIVVRSEESGVPELLSKITDASIINAGDGWHEHPSQALLDTLTILDHVGQDDMSGKIVTIVGDIRHSRVFGSMARLFPRLGATVQVVTPQTFVPSGVETFGIKIVNNLEAALPKTDVIYALRVQEERGAKGFVPSLGEYARNYCITPERLKLAKKEAILMHPGPVIRNIDVHTDLVNHPQSKIFQQVENGLAIRKAIIWLLAERSDGKKKRIKN